MVALYVSATTEVRLLLQQSMERMTNSKACFVALVLVAIVGCNKKARDKEQPVEPETSHAKRGADDASPRAAEVVEASTLYRVNLIATAPAAVVPFFLNVPKPEGKGVAEIRVGEESLTVPVTWQGTNAFALDFEILQARMEVSVVEGGLEGRWIQDSGSWGVSELAVKGEVVEDQESWRLFPSGAPPTQSAKTSGNWRIEMPDSGLAQLSVTIEGESAHGFLLFATGNRISLAGRVEATKLELAGFDSTSAYLLTAEMDSASELTKGQWLAGSSLAWQETFVGTPKPDFEITSGPTLNVPKSRVQIKGVNLKEYLGKPTIIELAGSWCITCRYAAPFLREIYAEFHPQGLEMLTLAYEFTDDEAYNNAQALKFKEQYSVDWEVAAVHGAPESFDEIMPKGFTGIDISGLPISIFIDREGRVTYFHAGFPASKDSEEYRSLAVEYRNEVRQLLGLTP